MRISDWSSDVCSSDRPVDRLVDEFRVNVGGALVAAQDVAPAMIKAKKGTILFTGGGFAYEPAMKYASLSLGKAALRSLAYTLAPELGTHGVPVATEIGRASCGERVGQDV